MKGLIKFDRVEEIIEEDYSIKYGTETTLAILNLENLVVVFERDGVTNIIFSCGDGKDVLYSRLSVNEFWDLFP